MSLTRGTLYKKLAKGQSVEVIAEILEVTVEEVQECIRKLQE